MLVRFIHCAGFRFDSPTWEDPNTGTRRNQDIWRIFETILRLCQSKKADMLFITGSLFDHDYIRHETITKIAKALSKLKGVHVFITPGETDPLVRSTPYRLIEWPENVYIFTGGFQRREVPQLQTVVYGKGWTTFHQEPGFLQDFQPNRADDLGKATFLLLPLGTDEEKLATTLTEDYEAQIAGSGLTYLALAAGNEPQIINKAGKTLLANCGSINPQEFSETNSYGIIFGETDGKTTTLEFIELAKGPHKEKPLTIDTQTLDQHNLDQHNLDQYNIENNIEATINEGPDDREFSTLPQFMLERIQEKLTDADQESELNYWELVRKIAKGALAQGREKYED